MRPKNEYLRRDQGQPSGRLRWKECLRPDESRGAERPVELDTVHGYSKSTPLVGAFGAFTFRFACASAWSGKVGPRGAEPQRSRQRLLLYNLAAQVGGCMPAPSAFVIASRSQLL